MMPHDAMRATSMSFSNHCSRNSAAPIVMIFTKASCTSNGSSRNDFRSGARGSHCLGSNRTGSGGVTERIGLMNRTICVINVPKSWYASASFAENRRISWYVLPRSFVIQM